MSKKLSQPERLLVARRRFGLTQAQAASKLRMPLHIYARVENGVLGASSCGYHVHDMMRGPITLAPHERCLIMRRRCNKTQLQVAKELGCSRYWLNQQELGKVPCDDLIWYWEQ